MKISRSFALCALLIVSTSSIFAMHENRLVGRPNSFQEDELSDESRDESRCNRCQKCAAYTAFFGAPVLLVKIAMSNSIYPLYFIATTAATAATAAILGSDDVDEQID